MRRRAGGGAELGRVGHGWDDDDGLGTLEIEFEDDEAPSGAAAGPVGRSRDLRPAALVALGVVTLGAALVATHHDGSGGGNNLVKDVPFVSVVAPDYAAAMVTVRYENARLVSLPARLIEVNLRMTPVADAKVRVLNYYVDENGVSSFAELALAYWTLPAAGVDATLDLTVNDCAVVPIGESMSFVNVVADGPAGIIDRFTILGERYSADLTRLLRTICPDRASGQNH
jgi:hypothetical protein